MSEWVFRNLDEVVEYFIDYRGKTPDKKDSGIPLITAKIVKNGHLQQPTEFISKEDYPLWMTRGYPEIDDVILTTEAPLGEVALLKDKNVALAQRIITLRGYKNVLDNKYLKYWIQSDQGQYELESRASGTTVFGIKASVLKKVPILIPLFKEQQAIASVLSSLDDKIDLLHRQNKTLESMAETLFRQWFIEEAQDDWNKIFLGKLFTVSSGKGLKRNEFNEYGSIPVLGANGKIGLTDKALFKEKLIYTGRVGTLGQIFIVDNQPVWLSDNTLVFRNIEYFYFTYFHLKAINYQEYNVGSTQPLIRQADIKQITIFYPSNENILIEFEFQAKELFCKIAKNHKQIQTLEKLRDTLLPKLMSGEVRVKYSN